MAEARASVRRTSTIKISNAMSEKLQMEDRKQSTTSTPTIPLEAPGSVGTADRPQNPPQYSDAPPSYEDAIAMEFPPVDAPRPDYAPPPAPEDDILRGDEKSRLRNRRDS